MLKIWGPRWDYTASVFQSLRDLCSVQCTADPSTDTPRSSEINNSRLSYTCNGSYLKTENVGSSAMLNLTGSEFLGFRRLAKRIHMYHISTKFDNLRLELLMMQPIFPAPGRGQFCSP